MIRSLITSVLLSAGAMAASDCSPLLNHQFKTLQGEQFDMCKAQGKAILVVNTASKCGFADQFSKLEAMYRDYKDKGLIVVGFPSNDFHQELEQSKEIAQFCKLTYFVEFPMMEASHVRGDDANPLFKQLAITTGEAPQWNFKKYLIAPDGKTVYPFSTPTEPDSDDVMSKLRPMLK